MNTFKEIALNNGKQVYWATKKTILRYVALILPAVLVGFLASGKFSEAYWLVFGILLVLHLIGLWADNLVLSVACGVIYFHKLVFDKLINLGDSVGDWQDSETEKAKDDYKKNLKSLAETGILECVKPNFYGLLKLSLEIGLVYLLFSTDYIVSGIFLTLGTLYYYLIVRAIQRKLLDNLSEVKDDWDDEEYNIDDLMDKLTGP